MNTNLLEQFKTAGHEALGPHRQVNVRRILTTTDFSDEARFGTDYAMRLASKLGASVLVLHVIELLPNMEGLEGFPLLPPRSEITRQARSRLKKIAQAQSVNRARVTTAVRIGKPFHAITVAASKEASDLIVMATHGYTGLDHALLGSTAERVVRHAPCSVLTVPARGKHRGIREPRLRIARILVPLDFSDTSKSALPWAAYLARSFGAEIVLFNVTEIFPIDHLMGREMTNHAITPLMHEARAALERIAENLGAATEAKVSCTVIDGVPHKEICHAAQEMRADLIVIATHGYTGLKHLWLGSTAERVVRRANCPVLVVREATRRIMKEPPFPQRSLGLVGE